jgi:transmembrane sensor
MSLLRRWLIRSSNASRWFARVRSERISKREDQALVAWLEQSEANARNYENSELAWGLALELRERPQVARWVEESLREAEAPKARRPALLPPAALIAAAGVLLVAVTTALVFELNRTQTAEYATRVGEQRVISLMDGSSVTLNTATELHVRYSRKWRSVELVRGEALFAVRPDAARPFVVLALGHVTTAVGTEFAVAVHGSSAAVSVLEGTVTVRPFLSSPDSAAVRVQVGQAVDYQAGGTPGPLRGADTDRIRAWQTHRILFSDMRLADAIEEYNRYTTTPIVLNAPALADRRVHGIFRVGDEEAFIQALERALPLRANRAADSVTLVAK